MKTSHLFLTTLLIFCFATGSLHAQLCQGSLGSPLVNITFGSGANPGSPLQAATTSYQFLNTDCPNDNFYTVRNNTSNCFNNTWHTLTSDHTGNPNGYFMLVNASVAPSAFYLDTVRGLCGGTTYEFAAWILNIIKPTACSANPVQPQLTFTIERTDGTVIQSYDSGIIPSTDSPVWKQYGFYFTTPAGVSDVVMRIFNNSPGGCGNDLALDDITFRPCGPQIAVTIDGVGATTTSICEGTARSLTFTGILSSGLNAPALQWQQSVNGGAWTDIAGQTNGIFTKDFPANMAPGVYSFRLSAGELSNIASPVCRVASEELTVTIHANPVPDAHTSTPICEGESFELTAKDGTDYVWTANNGFTGTGERIVFDHALPSHSGRYYVKVTNSDGCSQVDSTDVDVHANPVATTAFSSMTLCEGDDINLGGSGAGTYQWIPATGLSSATIANPVASPADTTHYTFVVTNSFGCADTAYTTLNVVSKPRVNAGPDQYIMKGNAIQLQATATGQNISFTWTPDAFMDDANVLNPVVKVPFDTTFTLTAISNEGCGVASDQVRIFVYPDIFVPNAFSPNNDGINDTWQIPALRAWKEYTVSVFNRHGKLIFHTKNTNPAWDGRYRGLPQPTGAYVYLIDIKDGPTLKGSLLIVR